MRTFLNNLPVNKADDGSFKVLSGLSECSDLSPQMCLGTPSVALCWKCLPKSHLACRSCSWSFTQGSRKRHLCPWGRTGLRNWDLSPAKVSRGGGRPRGEAVQKGPPSAAGNPVHMHAHWSLSSPRGQDGPGWVGGHTGALVLMGRDSLWWGGL